MAKKTRTKKTKKRARRDDRKTPPDETPRGFKLRHTLRGHRGPIGRIAWSSDGKTIASPSRDKTIRLWDTETGGLLRTLLGHETGVSAVAWSPDGRSIASGDEDGVLYIWDPEDRGTPKQIKPTPGRISDLAWSLDGGKLVATSGITDEFHVYDPIKGNVLLALETGPRGLLSAGWSHDAQLLATGDFMGSVHFWDADTGRLLHFVRRHSGRVPSLAWSPNEQILATGSYDGTIRVWKVAGAFESHILEGHFGSVCGVSFSADGRLLASKANDGTVRLWRTDTWRPVAQLAEGSWVDRGGLAFSRRSALLATLGDSEWVIRIWDLDLDVLLGAEPLEESAQYRNAKVVLVGNTSVGKTGLGLVLAGRKFRATESTHGRHVWVLDSEDVQTDEGLKATQETILWDLAGQPGYRLIHRLHLHEVGVALVLFDSRSETDPFAGVGYWARALDEATRGFPLVKFLVAARTDRGGPQVSKERIQQFVERYGFDGFFETSAKRGDGVDKLQRAIHKAIPWDKLPSVSTTALFKNTRDFLINQKKQGRFIGGEDELLGRFRQSKKQPLATPEVFTTCLGRLESAGLVRRLSVGDQVLLQPEMLDDYCGWLALGARDQPDGLGFLPEDHARKGKLKMDVKRHLGKRPAEERTILLATVEEVVGRGIAIRQQTEKGAMLVFPSELRTDLPDYPGGYSLAVAFQFEGPVAGIYATLAVTLINSITFKKKELYKNAALFEGPREQVCGFAVEYPDKANDALGRLTVFFDQDTDKTTRLLFLRYVNQQLEGLALEGTVKRQRIYYCQKCDETVPQTVVEKRTGAGETTVRCPVCDRHFPLDDLAERSADRDEQVDAIEADAAVERERQKRLTVLDERKRHRQYDVFLSHNSKDKPVVRDLADKLLDQGVLPWFDERDIKAGDLFTKKLEKGIDAAGVIAVIIGPHGPGRWHEMEYYAAIQKYVEDRDEAGERRARVIPVLLPGVQRKPKLPVFLRGLNYVDMRKGGPDDRLQMRKLVEAILTDRPRFS